MDLKQKDYKRLFQPCIDGNEIMAMFNLKPGMEVGVLKSHIKEAVLDQRVENEPEALKKMLVEKYQQMMREKENGRNA